MSKRFWSQTGHAQGGSAWGQKGSRVGGKTMMQATVRRRPAPAGRGRAGWRKGPGWSYQGGVRRSSWAQGMRPRTGGFTGIERKFYDTSLVENALALSSTGEAGEQNPSATICLNSITQGDGESQRDGRKATIQSCFVKGTFRVPPQLNQTATDSGVKIYAALILDTQTNGALADSEDVFVNISGDTALGASPMRNMQHTQRFRVLDTFECVMGDANIAFDGTNMEQNGQQVAFQLSSNLEFSTQYSGTTESIANITDNALNIIAYANSLTLAPTISYNARIRFVG